MDLSGQVALFSARFLSIFVEAAAFLLVGCLLAGLVAVFVRPADVARLVPRGRLSGVLLGSLLGIVFPVGEGGAAPVTRRLYHKGLPVGAGVAFMLAAPVFNPFALVSTVSAFGEGPILVGRYAVTPIVALSIGLLFTLARSPADVLRPGSMPDNAPDRERERFVPGLARALSLANADFLRLARYLLVGAVLAAALQALVPEAPLRSVATHPVLSVLVMAGLAVLVSAGSTTDAALALAFVDPLHSFTFGALLTFLVLGPMVDVKNVLLALSVYRPRAVLYMSVLAILITILIGVWVNLNVRL